MEDTEHALPVHPLNTCPVETQQVPGTLDYTMSNIPFKQGLQVD